MPDYLTTSRTKDHFQDQLLRDHPEIVSIAPRLKLDDQGRPTNDAVIVIGIKKINPIRFGPGTAVRPQSAPLPTKLPVITAQGAEDTTQSVEVIVQDEGEVVLEAFTVKSRPCPGGYSVGHARVAAGTLGGVARVGSNWDYILSNNHVLAAENSGAVGDPISQPGVDDGGTSADTIGYLDRWVPVDLRGSNEVDCAFAKALDPHHQNVSRHVEGIGTPAAVADATVGQAVRKSGRTTEVATGAIVSDNATVRLGYAGGQAVFVNQLQYTRMTQGGDSGSLVWDQSSLNVLGLHFAGSRIASYGNKIKRVLQLISQAHTVYDAQGKITQFPKIDAYLEDHP